MLVIFLKSQNIEKNKCQSSEKNKGRLNLCILPRAAKSIHKTGKSNYVALLNDFLYVLKGINLYQK